VVKRSLGTYCDQQSLWGNDMKNRRPRAREGFTGGINIYWMIRLDLAWAFSDQHAGNLKSSMRRPIWTKAHHRPADAE